MSKARQGGRAVPLTGAVLAPILAAFLAGCATAPEKAPEAQAPGAAQGAAAAASQAAPAPPARVLRSGTPGCPLRPESIQVALQATPATLDTSQDTAALRQLGSANGMAPSHGQLAGLYIAQFVVSGPIRVATRGNCLEPDMRLTLQVTRSIKVASDHPPGSCRHAVALAHEREHEAIDDAMLAQVDRVLGDRLRAILAEPNALRAPGAERLGEKLRQGVAPALSAFQAERNRRQLAIDTPAEYARLSRVCPPGS
jgi:hypothetical protein